MRSDGPCMLELNEVASLLRGRQLGVNELTEATIERIDELNPRLNCFITVMREQAARTAECLDRELREGTDRGPLHGIPVTLKDNIMTAGTRTTAGSPTLDDWVPDCDADVVRSLKAAGAVILAKANMLQYAYGGFHALYGEVLNPHDRSRTCGGSSSGSAAAVSARLGYGSVGTDTGGSVRWPAAFCGVVGLKPTFGLVSIRGVIPVSANLDHVGPIARSARDVALMLDAMVGRHGLADHGSFAERLGRDVAGVRIGIAASQPNAPTEPTVAEAVRDSISCLMVAGATARELVIPDLATAELLMYTISGAEACEYHTRNLERRPEDYNDGIRTRLETARLISAVDYIHAQRLRRRVQEQVNTIFEEVDVVALPAAGRTAYPRDVKRTLIRERDVAIADVGARFNALFNLTGNPAISLPCAYGADGLPIGLQLVARHGQEALLLQIADAYQQSTDWHRRRPALS